MSETTLNGRAVTSLAVLLPRVGAWTADVELDTAEAPTGRVSIAVAGTLTLSGTVVRGGAEAARWRGRIVGGAGGLLRDVPAVAQQGSTLGFALADALQRAGESLAADSGDLATVAPLWHRIAGPAAHAVADVARAAGCAWRVRPDGAVWVGRETWDEHRPDVDVVDWRPDLGRLELAGDVLGILPGQTLAARDLTVRVGCVEHRATADALRTVVLAEPEERERGRLLDAVARLVAALTRRVDHQALYPATVVTQRADGTLDLQPDDARVPGCRGVPLRYGLPGVRATVPAGTRVLLTYEGGSPARPVATLWELGDVTRLRVNAGIRRVAREGDVVEAGSDPNPLTPGMTEWMASVTTALNALVGPGTIQPAPSVLGEIAGGSDVVHLP